MDILEIRETIEAELADQIGAYTFSNGETTPAIRVDDGVMPYEEEPTIEGLEVVIQPSLEVPLIPMLGGYRQTWTTRIVLKQWDIERDTLTAMDTVSEALMVLPDVLVTDRRRMIRSTRLDNIETCTITIQQSELVTIDG